MHVAELWIHPVKSMIGQRVEHVDVGPEGVAGDRAWAVVDDGRGGIVGGKQLGALMRLRAAYAHGQRGDVVITMPDGSSVRSDDATVDARLSAAVDRRVTLNSLQPADELARLRAGAPAEGDPMVELRNILGLVDGEPLPDLSAFVPGSPGYVPAPNTFVDARPVMLITTSTLAALRRALPESAIDVRRFRPNIVIDTGDEPGCPELGWAGRSLVVGDVTLDVLGPCVRCVMITREIDHDAPADRTIMRHVVAARGPNVGAYAAVSTAGSLAIGDPVALTSSTSDHR
jgi:uncharacterized protein YcbX